jgi:hypothetical protein
VRIDAGIVGHAGAAQNAPARTDSPTGAMGSGLSMQ